MQTCATQTCATLALHTQTCATQTCATLALHTLAEEDAPATTRAHCLAAARGLPLEIVDVAHAVRRHAVHFDLLISCAHAHTSTEAGSTPRASSASSASRQAARRQCRHSHHTTTQVHRAHCLCWLATIAFALPLHSHCIRFALPLHCLSSASAGVHPKQRLFLSAPQTKGS